MRFERSTLVSRRKLASSNKKKQTLHLLFFDFDDGPKLIGILAGDKYRIYPIVSYSRY